MPLVELVDIHRHYGPIHALRGVSLSLEPGTIGLVGNNGSGKSTLLKILLGLLRPSAGDGSILGVPLAQGGRGLRTRIGYMAETAAAVPLLSGVEFVTLSGDLYGMPHRDAMRRAHEVLQYVGLGELRYRRLEEYSTGNLQRLKLAAALVHDPELLLLDEPTNGLDPPGREAFLRLLADLVAETGKSLILSTHLLSDIERLCTHVVVLEQGRVLECGRLADLRVKSQNCFALVWRGEDGPFLGLLKSAGFVVEAVARGGAARVIVDPEVRPRKFFELAREAKVVLTQVMPDDDDLEQAFFRLVDAEGRNGR